MSKNKVDYTTTTTITTRSSRRKRSCDDDDDYADDDTDDNVDDNIDDSNADDNVTGTSNNRSRSTGRSRSRSTRRSKMNNQTPPPTTTRSSSFLMILGIFSIIGCCYNIGNVQAFVIPSSSTTTSSSKMMKLTATTRSTLKSSSSTSLLFLVPPSQSSSSSSVASYYSFSNTRTSSSRMIEGGGGRGRRRRQLQRGTHLTTTSNDDEIDDDGSSKSKNNIFSKAIIKFKNRPVTYCMIPIIAACVGWFTNYLAVQMIFYPIQYKGLALFRRPEIPLGFIGWQGIVPCKTKTMSKALTDMVQEQLLTIPEAFERLNPKLVARHLCESVPMLGTDIIQDTMKSKNGFPVVGLWNFITHPKRIYTGIVKYTETHILTGVMKDLIHQSSQIFNLENCVVNQMLLDRGKLGQLFQKVGAVELDFLVDSGLWFGFLLGLIQMCVALVWDNPWSLSIGGMIVGLATNWLALKWIFEPVLPTKICFGLFEIQGMFLKRQNEVAIEFSKFFANNIVTSEQIWSSILTDPSTKPTVYTILEKHVRRLLSIVSLGLLKGLPKPELIGQVTASTITKLPSHLPKALHRYVDSALGLETTLRTQMELMSPAKFERVLHPIFEQDELTLIIAGGVLGFLAGLIQQGIETGAITIPPLPIFISNILNKWKTIVFKLRRRIFGGSSSSKGGKSDNGDGISGE